MIKKTIKFTNFNGVESSKDLYFHVSRTSLLTTEDDVYNEIVSISKDLLERGKVLEKMGDMEVNEENPFDENNQLLVQSVRMVARLLDRLVDLAYGERSEDGSKFLKGKDVVTAFKQTAAYEAFVNQLIANPDEMINLINSLMSK